MAQSRGDDSGGIGIAAVERDTGIGKETLRVWERRYGFPTPRRDASGERLYPPEQVQRLRLVKRLLDAGHRPGRIVNAEPHELAALLQPAGTPSVAEAATQAPEIATCLALLRAHEAQALRRAMAEALLRRGLAGGIAEVLAPLTARVAELWLGGELQLFEERLCTETLQRTLSRALDALPPAPAGGLRVLLSTLPGEAHAASLLMAEALLGLEGAACLSLGPQAPLAQLPPAAAAWRADTVLLAFDGQLSGRAAAEGLAALRAQLPAEVEIWALATGRGLRLPACPGVRALEGVAGVGKECARRRELLESRV